jgi:hypothetical protein
MRRLALLAILGSVLVACGDDTDDVAPTTTTTIGSTTTTTTALTTTTTSSRRPATTSPVTLRCKTVGFTPNSEDAASDITATGLSCAEAESFVRIVGRQTSPGGPQEVDVQGYHCVRTGSEQEPLPRAFYQCVDGAKKVTFARS